MQKREVRQSGGIAAKFLTVLFGALLALGIELLILLLGSVAVSAGVLKPDAGLQVSVAACLISCFAGGSAVCKSWGSRRLPGGLLAGLICWVLILVIALFAGDVHFGTEAWVELASCVVGGGLASLATGRKKSKKRRKYNI